MALPGLNRYSQQYRNTLSQMQLDENNNPIVPQDSFSQYQKFFTPVSRPGTPMSTSEFIQARNKNKELARYNSNFKYGKFLDTETGQYVSMDELMTSETFGGLLGQKSYQAYNKTHNESGRNNLSIDEFGDMQYLFPYYDSELEREDGGKGAWIMAASKRKKDGGLEEVYANGLDVYNTIGEQAYDKSFFSNIGTGFWNSMQNATKSVPNVIAWVTGLGELASRSLTATFWGPDMPTKHMLPLDDNKVDKWAKEWSEYMDTFGTKLSSMKVTEDPRSIDAFAEGVGSGLGSIMQYGLLGYPGVAAGRALGFSEKAAYFIGMAPASMTLTTGEAIQVAAEAGIPKEDRLIFAGIYGIIAGAIEMSGANLVPGYLVGRQGTREVAKTLAKELGQEITQESVERAAKNTTRSALKRISELYTRATAVPFAGGMIEEFAEEGSQSLTMGSLSALYDTYIANPESPIGMGRFGKYFDEEMMKEALWEASIGGVVGAAGSGITAITSRKRGDYGLAAYVATGQENSFLSEARNLLQSGIITQNQYDEVANKINFLSRVKGENEQLFYQYLNEDNYSKMMTNALATLADNESFINSKLKQKEENPDALVDLPSPTSPLAASFIEKAVDNIILGNYKKFRSQLEQAGLNNYASYLDDAYSYYKKFPKELTSPKYRPFSAMVLTQVLGREFDIANSVQLETSINSDFDSILKSNDNITLEELRAQQLKLQLEEIKSLYTTELSKEEKDSRAKVLEKNPEMEDYYKHADKVGAEFLESKIASIEKELEDLKDAGVNINNTEALDALKANQDVDMIKEATNLEVKLKTSEDYISYFSNIKTLDRLYNKIIARQEAEEAKKRAEEEVRRKEMEEAAKKNTKKGRKKDPTSFDNKESIKRLNEAKYILSHKEDFTQEEIDAAQDLVDKVEGDESNEIVNGQVRVLTPNEASIADDLVSEGNLNTDNTVAHKGKTSGLTTITNLAYLHNNYIAIEENGTRILRTERDPVTGRIVQNPNADRRLSLPTFMNVGTRVVLYIDKDHPMYEANKDNLASIPIAIQTVEDYNQSPRPRPTTFVHDLAWIAKTSPENKMITDENRMPISFNVAEGHVGEVFRSTKQLRELLFANRDADDALYESEITIKSNGWNNISNREIPLTDILKKDPRTFLAIGILAGLDTDPTKLSLIPPELHVASQKGIYYLLFPNASGTYSYTRVIQKSLRDNPELHEKYTTIVTELIWDYLTDQKYSKTVEELRNKVGQYIHSSARTTLKVNELSAYEDEFERRMLSIRKDLVFHMFDSQTGQFFLNLPHPTLSHSVYRTEEITDSTGKKSKVLFSTKLNSENKLDNASPIRKDEFRTIIKNAIAAKYPMLYGPYTMDHNTEVDVFDLDDNGNLRPITIKYIDFIEENDIAYTVLEPIEVNGVNTYTSQPNIGYNTNVWKFGEKPKKTFEELLDEENPEDAGERFFGEDIISDAVFQLFTDSDVVSESVIRRIAQDISMGVDLTPRQEAIRQQRVDSVNRYLDEIRNASQEDTSRPPIPPRTGRNLLEEDSDDLLSGKPVNPNSITSIKNTAQATNDPELLRIVTDNLDRLNITSFTRLKDVAVENDIVRGLTDQYIEIEQRNYRRTNESRDRFRERMLNELRSWIVRQVVENKKYYEITGDEAFKDLSDSYQFVLNNFNPQLDKSNGRVFIGYAHRILGELETLDFKMDDEVSEDTYDEVELAMERSNHLESWNLRRDPEKSASARVRRFLYRIKVPTGLTSPLGLPINEDYSKVFNALLVQFHDVPINEMDSALEEATALSSDEAGKALPESAAKIFTQVRNALEARAATEPSFKAEFYRVLHKHQNVLKTVLLTPPKRTTKYPQWRVVDSNTRGSIGMIVDKWKNNFYKKGRETGLIRIGDNNTLEINRRKGLDLKNRFTQMLRKHQGSTSLNKALVTFFETEFGISIDYATFNGLHRIYKNKNGYFFKKYFSHLTDASPYLVFVNNAIGPILEGLTQEETSDESFQANNPFYKQQGVLSVLAKLYLIQHPDTYSTSFRDSHNNSVYGFVEASYATETMRKLTELDPLYVSKKQGNAFSRNSTWLNTLLNLEEKNRSKYRFQYSTLDASKNVNNYEGAVDYNRQSDREREATRLNLFINNGRENMGHYMWITPSDKQSIPIITATKQKFMRNKVGRMFFEGNINLMEDPYLITVLYDNIVASEIARINTVKRAFNDVRAEAVALSKMEGETRIFDDIFRELLGKKLKNGYHYYGNNLGAGAYFLLIPELNEARASDGSKLINNTDLDPIDLTLEDIAEVKTFIARHFEGLTKERVADWKKIGLVDMQKEDAQITYEYMTKIGEVTSKDSYRFANMINYAAADYVINYAIAMTNIAQLFTGDPALFYKIPKNWKPGDWRTLTESALSNMFKRTAKDIAPGMEGLWEPNNRRVNYVFANIGKVSSDTAGYSKKLASYMGTNYDNIDMTDGQEWVTTEEYLNTLYAFGYIKKEVRDGILEKLRRDEILNPKELKFLLNPQKPVYVGSEIWNYVSYNEETNGHEEHYYIKPSSLPLIPQLTKQFEKLDKLRRELETKNVHRLVFSSTVKLGGFGEIDIFNPDGTLKDNISIESHNIKSLSREGLRIQQEVPSKYGKDISKRGAQYSVLQFADISPTKTFTINGIGGVKGEQLFRLDGKITTELYRRKFEKLLAELGVSPVEITKDDGTSFTIYEPTDLSKIKNMLINEAITRKGWTYGDLIFLNVFEDMFIYGEAFQIPLFFHPAVNKIEALLNSIISNRVLKRQLPGKQYVQGSPAGFDGPVTMSLEFAEDTYGEQIVFTENYRPGKRLAYQDDENGLYMEILMPFIFKTANGEVLNVRDFINPETGLIDPNKLHPELLNLIGYRVPTQGNSSMARLKVVGFLPITSADLIIVPAEWLRQSGSDFDIDKLFTHHFHYTYDRDEKVLSKLAVPPFRNFTSMSYDVPNMSDAELENILIDITFSILRDDDMAKEQLKSLDNDDLDKVIKELDKYTPKEERKANSIINIKTQSDAIEMGASGQLGISIFSLFSTGHIFRQYGNVYLAPKMKNLEDVSSAYEGGDYIDESIPILFLKENGELYEDLEWGDDYINNRVTSLSEEAILAAKEKRYYQHGPYGVMKTPGAWRLDKVYGFTGKPISAVIRNYQNASVDNASKPQLHKLFLNSETFDIAGLLASVGFDEELIAFFLRQPIIAEYVNALLNSKGFIRGSFEASSARKFAEEVYKDAGFTERDMSITAFSLSDLKASLADNNADKTMRAQLLFNFIQWKKLASQLTESQTAFNTQSKLLSKSIYSTILKRQNANYLAKDKGFIRNLANLKDLDTQTGGAFEYGINMGSLLFNSSKLIPINSAVINNILGEYARQTKTIGHLREDVVNMLMTGLRSSVYSTIANLIASSDPDYQGMTSNQIREKLLFGKDSTKETVSNEDRNTLAVRLMLLQATSNNLFLKMLQPKLAEEMELPDTIEFFGERGMYAAEVAQMQSSWLELFKQPKNSVEYKMARDLLLYTWLNGSERHAYDFGRFVPPDIYDRLNVAEHLYNIDLRDAKKNAGGIGGLIPANFLRQFFQHNPFRTLGVTTDDIANYTTRDGGAISPTNPIVKFTIKSKDDSNSTTGRLMTTSADGARVFVDYVYMFDKLSRVAYLYEKRYENGGEDLVYTLIPTLGWSSLYLREYDLYEAEQSSVIGKNYEALVLRKKGNKSHLAKIAEATGNVSKGIREKVTMGREIAKNHGFDKGIESVLNSIIANGTKPGYKALAQYLKERIRRIEGWRLEFYDVNNQEHWRSYANQPDWSLSRKLAEERANSSYLKGRTLNRAKIIVINAETITSRADFEKTFLHENIHAYVNYLIDNEQFLSQEEKNALTSLRGVIKKLRDDESYIAELQERTDNESGEILYALGLRQGAEFGPASPRALTEFMATVLTNSVFQVDLNNKPFQRTSILKRIWNIISSLLGFTAKKNSMLATAMENVLTILDNPNAKLAVDAGISSSALSPSAAPKVVKYPYVVRNSIRLEATRENKKGTIETIDKKYTRNSVQRDPNSLYIFTDNTDRTSGTTANVTGWYADKYGSGLSYGSINNPTTAVIRGLDNAFPVSTMKWFYRLHNVSVDGARWSDSDINEFKQVIDDEINTIKAAWDTGKYNRIVLPMGDGLFNTSISAINEQRVPLINNYLDSKIKELREYVETTKKPSTTTAPNRYLEKDQKKSYQATKFIGRGSEGSNTNKYRLAWGPLANSGNYSNTDFVFVSAEGNRAGRLTVDLNELQKAIDAGATIITDTVEDRNKTYNVGERQVATYLDRNGYKEDEPGFWIPDPNFDQKQDPIEESSPIEQEMSQEEIDRALNNFFGIGEDTEGSSLISGQVTNIDTIVARKREARRILYQKLSQRDSNKNEIIARINRLDLQIKALQKSRSTAALRESLRQDTKEIRVILNRVKASLNEKLTYDQVSTMFYALQEAGYYIDVWQNIREILPLGTNEEINKEMLVETEDLNALAREKLNLMKMAAIYTANNFSWRTSFTEDELFMGVQEIGSIPMNTLGIKHSNATLVKVAYTLLNSMEMGFNREYYTKRMEIEAKVAEAVKNLGMSKEQIWDKLSQKYSNGKRTGNLIYKYKQEYWDEIKSRADHAKATGKWGDYWKFIRENTKPITDAMITGEEQGFFNDEDFAKQKRLWQKYQDDREAFKDVLFSNPNIRDENKNFINKSAERHFENSLALWDQNNSPIEYMKQRRGESKKKYKGNSYGRNYIVGDIPNDNWLDPRFKEVESNPKLMAFYQYVDKTFRENNNLLPYRKGTAPNALPSLEKSFVEDVRDSNFFRAMGGLASDIKNELFKPSKGEDTREAHLGGKNIQFIQTPMAPNRLSPEEKTYDLEKLMLAHTAVAIGYKYKAETEPVVNAMADLLSEMTAGEQYNLMGNVMKVFNKDGSVRQTNNPLVNTREHLIGTIQGMIYNNYTNENELFKIYSKEEREEARELHKALESETDPYERSKIQRKLMKLGKYMDGNVAIDYLNKYTYALGLGFPNVISPMINHMYGVISNFTYAAGSKYVTDKNMWEATKMMWAAVSRKAATKLDAKSLLKIYAFMDSMSLLTHIVETSRNETNKIVTALVTLQSKAEYMNQGALMIAILKTLAMKDKNGNKVSLWDAYTLDENDALVWNVAKMGEEVQAPPSQIISEDGRNHNFARVAGLIAGEIGKAHGDYKSIMVGKRKGWFRLLMLYKTWLAESVYHRFGELAENPDTGEMEKGRYRSYLDAVDAEGNPVTVKDKLTSFAAAMLRLSQKNSFKDFSEMDKANLSRNAREMQFILLLAGIVLLLSRAVDDEEEKGLKYAYFTLINALNRARADISFYTNPNSFINIIGSPVAAVTALANAARIVDVVYDHVTGEGTLKTGPYKDWTKFEKWAMQVTPGGSGVLRMINAGSKVFESR